MTTYGEGSLTAEELRVWHAFKRAGESVRAAVADEITRATGLSDADFGILTRLDDAGGSMRQNDLAVLMAWHRSRLSHQLTRMQARGLVERSDTRSAAGRGVEVAITDAGRHDADRARPVHAVAVRHHLIDRLPVQHTSMLIELFAGLAERATPTEAPG